MRKTLYVCSSVGLILLLFLTGSFSTDTYWGRYLWWNFPDSEDHERFSKNEIQNKLPVFQFTKATPALALSPRILKEPALEFVFSGREPLTVTDLDQFLQKSNTTSFLVIKNDTILYEKYFEGRHRASVNTTFSIAKSVLSLLTGIAIDKGYIRSVHDPIIRYLPELEMNGIKEITLHNLLSMTSGLENTEYGAVPWASSPRQYYSTNLRRLALSIKPQNNSRSNWQYNAFNSVLLGLILEEAVGMSVSQFLEEQLWEPLGMEFNASWSIDSEVHQLEKMANGLNLSSIDMAKIGRLIGRQGNWNGTQIISEKWVRQSTAFDSNAIVLSRASGEPRSLLYKFHLISSSADYFHNTDNESDSHSKQERCCFYKYYWWGLYNDEDETIAKIASGNKGQFIFVDPKTDLIIVRTGKARGGLADEDWYSLFLHISNALNQS